VAVESQALIVAIASLDLALLALAVIGFLRGGLGFFSSPLTLEAAFADLDVSIQEAFPSIPPGYTMREALRFVKESGLKVKWNDVEACLTAYEGRRYGGLTTGSPPFSEIGRLSSKLRRHGFLSRA
jgi:hypothetical protein